MTARPIEIEDRCRVREARTIGGAGSDGQRLPFVVLVDNVRSLWNVGSIFRTADACGVERLILAGITGTPPRAEITKTALGAEQAVAWSYVADPAAGLASLRSDGYVPVALETSPRAIPVGELSWPARPCLVVGNEVSGITPSILEACKQHVAIPMAGVKSSLNVAVAFGIAAFSASQSIYREPMGQVENVPN